jgi:hypothetical protein
LQIALRFVLRVLGRVGHAPCGPYATCAVCPAALAASSERNADVGDTWLGSENGHTPGHRVIVYDLDLTTPYINPSEYTSVFL